MPSLFSLFIDPKGLFAISTLLSLLFVEADESSQTLKLSVPTMDKVIAYFNCQLFLAVLGMLILVLIITAGDIQRNKLTSRELRLAAWFLWSGTVFHVAMDGGGVVFKQPQLLRENYQRMDNRFRSHVPFNRGGPHESEVLGAMTVVLIEIFVQAPMCLVSYVAVMKRLSWRNEMALATLSINICLLLASHIMGVFYFMVPELLNGCRGMVPIGEVGCLPPLTMYTYFYFYFGVGANLIWFFPPLGFMYGIYKDNQKAVEAASAKKSK